MLNIGRDHFIFSIKNSVQALSHSFLKQHGLNYFQYLRCYEDGAINCLINDTRLFEFALATIHHAPVVFSSYKQEHEKLSSYWFLWDEELPPIATQCAREFQLYHGMTWVKRSKKYYDMIAVALPKPIQNPASFYLTKCKVIESFIQTFEKDHPVLFSQFEKNAIMLPMSYRDVNYQKICLQTGRFEIEGPQGVMHTTTQELACLRLLLQGATYKQIARRLSISPRTVETYVNRVKNRAGLSQRADLNKLISICT